MLYFPSKKFFFFNYSGVYSLVKISYCFYIIETKPTRLIMALSYLNKSIQYVRITQRTLHVIKLQIYLYRSYISAILMGYMLSNYLESLV